MISLDISCTESRYEIEEEALTVSSSKSTRPINTLNQSVHKSEYDRFCDRLVTWNKDVCRKETGTIAGKGILESVCAFVLPHICVIRCICPNRLAKRFSGCEV